MAMPRGRFPTSVRLLTSSDDSERPNTSSFSLVTSAQSRPGFTAIALGPLADVHRADTVDGTRGGELDDMHGVAVLVGHDELIDADAIVERDAHRPRPPAPALVAVPVPASAPPQGHRQQDDRPRRVREPA